MYEVTYTKKAYRNLKKIDKTQQIFIISWIEKNLVATKDPRTMGQPLKGQLGNYWRYRIGTYRVIADIRDNEVTIIVVNIGHRKDIYKLG